jgi:hypothetical protein
MNISRESDIVQALPLLKDGGDQNVPQQKPSRGDHNITHYQKATFSEVAKQFMQAIIITKTPWPFMSHEQYMIVDKA